MSAWTYRHSDGKAARKIVPPRFRIPYWKGLGADSEEKREPVSDIDTAEVDSLKALDPNRPIREADKILQCRECPLCTKSRHSLNNLKFPIHHIGIDQSARRVRESSWQSTDDSKVAVLPQAYCPLVARNDKSRHSLNNLKFPIHHIGIDQSARRVRESSW